MINDFKVNANMTQKEQIGVKITNQLEQIKKDIKERKARVEGRIEKEGKFISVLKTELLDAKKEEEECTSESLVVEQRMKEMMELIKQNQRNQQAARARERVNDYVQNVSLKYV
jgi:tetrahydromethanopterin S-methyltransferase subunit A